MEKEAINFVKGMEMDDDDKFDNKTICSEVGLFSDHLSACTKNNMFSDLFRMRWDLH